MSESFENFDMFSEIENVVGGAVKALSAQGALPGGLEAGQVTVELPRDSSHGDLATNAAMVLAKQAGMKPRDLAEKLAAALRDDDTIETAEIAGPGFINLTLNAKIWPDVIRGILAAGEAFGANDLGQGRRVNVEYVSANPTGPMHVGHCRGAVFGDALANLLEKSGFDVTREYYVNDAGAQIDVLAQSAYLRYRQALGEDIGEIPPGLYPGDYLVPIGETLAETHGRALLDVPEEDWLPVVRDAAVDAMMAEIRRDLEALDIRHDVFFSERDLVRADRDEIAKSVELLKDKDLIFKGKLPPPKGQLPEDWEDREQTLFRATSFGDDLDRPLLKSDGAYTYFAADIAYHNNKIARGFDQLINIWGADHGGYVKRMAAAVTALSDDKVDLDVKLCQLVRLLRDGDPVKMSKRAGDFITLREVVEEVGRDSVRFMMLYRKNDAPLDFDFIKVTEQSRENPVFYVQYAHARIHSVLRNAGQLSGVMDPSVEALAAAPLEMLTHPAEIAVVRQLAAFPRVVRAAARTHEPHRIAFYLYEVASSIHALWTLGKELPQLRFISEDEAMTLARLAFLRAAGHVLASGLGILGVRAPVEMK